MKNDDYYDKCDDKPKERRNSATIGEVEKLRSENANFRIALERIRDTWDISDPSRVVPKYHNGETARNDSLAANSILLAVKSLSQRDQEA